MSSATAYLTHAQHEEIGLIATRFAEHRTQLLAVVL
jgi:hypothetical protein